MDEEKFHLFSRSPLPFHDFIDGCNARMTPDVRRGMSWNLILPWLETQRTNLQVLGFSQQLRT